MCKCDLERHVVQLPNCFHRRMKCYVFIGGRRLNCSEARAQPLVTIPYQINVNVCCPNALIVLAANVGQATTYVDCME